MNRRMRIGLFAIFSVCIAALIVLAFIQPVILLQGWLAAFVWSAMIPIGALILLLVNRITGGNWGAPLGPVLESAARAIAGTAVIAIPVLIFSAGIYRWASSPETPKSLTGAYMTSPLFALRTVIAFGIWGTLAWMPGWRSSTLHSAVGMFLLAVITNIIPVDWVVSSQPGFYSSDFGFGFAVEQVLSALALCAALGVTGGDERITRNLAGMLIAAILGTVYMYYMEFTVIWYGNLPGKVDWFNTRGNAPWAEIGGSAFAIGALVPFLFLLNDKVRGSANWLRMIGATILFGELLHVFWLMVPVFGLPALLPAGLAVLAFAAAAAFWLMATMDRWTPEQARKEMAAQSNV
jgi:hypothetical protein